MISPNHPHDRESLSALFDGELHGDASRFAHKRLAQDVQWRQACGRWLLAGDVLRGRASAAAPAGFADRVQRALVQESAAPALAPAAMVGSRRRWIPGAALAASVAVAAWFVAGPLDDTAPVVVPAATIATAAPAPAASTPPAPMPSTAVVTAGETPSSRASARPPRGQGQRMANAGSRPPPAAIVASASAAAADLPVVAAGSASNGIDATALADPFGLPPTQVASRPWPRAVLPNYPVAGALTAGYGGRPQNSDASDSPGFYPFEPRLPATTAAPADSR